MSNAAVAGLVAGIVLSSVPRVSAAGWPGATCGISSLTDPRVEGSMTAEIKAAVRLSDDTDPSGTYTGYVRCTVQTGTNDRHSEADAGTVQGPTGVGLAAAAGTVTFAVGREEDLYVCTEVVTGDGTRYWDEVSWAWSSDPDASCYGLVASEPEPRPGPTEQILCEVLGHAFPPEGDGGDLDECVCPAMARVLPPEGDVPLVWDCPPYDASVTAGLRP